MNAPPRSDSPQPSPRRRWLWLLLPALCCSGAAPLLADPPPRRGNGDLRAQLTPRQHTVLAAGMAGRILQLTVAEGETFPQGQVLVRFDCQVQQARLRKAQAELQTAEKKSAAARRLLELKSATDLELELEQSAARQAAAEVDLHRALVARCTIPAPFAGQVTSRSAQPHQFVAEGQPILDILDNHGLEAVLIVPSRWIPRLTPGTPFFVRVDETGQEYPATVTRLASQVDAVSQSIKVIGRFQEEISGLMAGMSGTARFPTLQEPAPP